MEKRLNFNTEVDDLTKINEFFQNAENPFDCKVQETFEVQNLKPLGVNLET